LLLDEVDDVAFQANVIERVDLLNSCRAGHVDFGEITANHIQADEVQPVGPEQRRQRHANFPIAFGYLRLHALAADMNIAAGFRFERNPQHRPQRRISGRYRCPITIRRPVSVAASKMELVLRSCSFK